MRCWLLPAGSSLESMTVLGVTPLALWGSAQVLMVLTSSSMVMARRANICTAQAGHGRQKSRLKSEPCGTIDGASVLARACTQAAGAAGSEPRVACAPAPGRGNAAASSAAAARLVRRSPRGGMRAHTWPDQGQGWSAHGHGSDGPVPRRTARASEASSLPRPQPGMQGVSPAHAALPTFGIGVLSNASGFCTVLRYFGTIHECQPLGWRGKKTRLVPNAVQVVFLFLRLKFEFEVWPARADNLIG